MTPIGADTHDHPPLLPAPEQPLVLPAPAQPLLLPRPASAAAPGSARPRSHRLYWIAAGVLLGLLLVGWFFHHRQAERAKQATADARDRLPSLGVIVVKASPRTADLLLPGSINPVTEASLYARASGYLRERYVDIGDTVKRGQVLAIVDSPDLDQQVVQGRAAVAQARQQLGQNQASVADAQARLALARITTERTDELGRDNAVAQQEVDQRRQERDTAKASLTMSLANVGAAQANVRAVQAGADRLAVLQDFEKIRAPFDGVVTARNVDLGALIGSGGGTSMAGMPSNASSEGAASSGASGTTASAGSTGASGSGAGQAMELFRIGQVGRLRVFVNVPQDNASAVATGTAAQVFVAGHANAFVGQVTRTAQSLDPSARTLLTEVQIDNPRHELMPGMYAQVRFSSPRTRPPLLVPGEAVIARATGLTVAVIEDLRPEDRKRLPAKPTSAKPPEPAAGEPDKKAGGAKASKGDDKDAKATGDQPGSAKNDDGAGRQDDDPADAKRIHLQPVKIGRDYGTEVEIVDGLQAGAKIVANPGDDVAEGALVMPRERKDEAAEDKPGAKSGSAVPQGNQSPSMVAPTKGRK